ncbi:MAG: DUF475 domain-containing protein [Desulfomicrobium sp.]|nr:DUF475 domain-containing protein [Desulfomicrobium sp.]
MAPRSTISYFLESIILSLLGLAGAFYLGYHSGGLPMALAFLLTTSLLACLETSVSLDNAVVNATVLRVMTPFWRIMFLTVGIAIAVFGMRILFPILIISVAGHMEFSQAWIIATTRPEEYRQIMEASHLGIMGFGGTFLLVVALTYFLNKEKETHWLPVVERMLSKVGGVDNAAASLTIGLVMVTTLFIPSTDKYIFLISSLSGFAVHALIDVLKHVVGGGDIVTVAGKNGLVGLLYLEVLDSSFSFDGVVAAFAITNKFWLIAIGLGIGALFVRSMTVYLVAKGTLEQYIYLEPAAFWAIGFLVLVMFMSAAGHHLPGGEITTGLASMVILGAGVLTSIIQRRIEEKLRACRQEKA